ncbi:MAG: hypothetical protein KAR20_16485 [Candidatus Heimdallarchaeota archaeon]|nr:hypothetical protein [Candidatus Heimdallarchaeota archaeon]
MLKRECLRYIFRLRCGWKVEVAKGIVLVAGMTNRVVPVGSLVATYIGSIRLGNVG